MAVARVEPLSQRGADSGEPSPQRSPGSQEDCLPISERGEGIAFDYAESNPGVNDVPFERITAPTLIAPWL